MKNRSRRSNVWVYALIGGISTFLVLAFVGWEIFYRLTTEPSTTTLLTRNAFLNRWLALESLGENYGVAINSNWTIDVDNMPPVEDTIVLEDVRSAIPDGRLSIALENWVLDGGNLIYRVPIVYFTQDPVETVNSHHFPSNLMAFEQRPLRIIDTVDRLLRTREKFTCGSFTTPTLLNNGDVADIEFPQSIVDAGLSILNDVAPNTDEIPGVKLLDTSLSPFSDAMQILAPNRLLVLPYGNGRVYLITDLYQWANHYIDCADNAYAFLHLVSSTVDVMPGILNELSVWIVPRVPFNTPKLLELAWQHYYLAIIGIFLTFFLAWIAHNIRSSPPVHAIPIPRRATINYVTRVTEFAWRNRDIGSYFKALSWISKNPKGVFGPQTAIENNQNNTKRTTNETQKNTKHIPDSEEDLIVAVRKLQTELKNNMQPSIKKSKEE